MLFNQANSGINFDNYENIPVEMSGDDTPVAIERVCLNYLIVIEIDIMYIENDDNKKKLQFMDADLHTWIQENIARSGYTKPTPVQVRGNNRRWLN